MANQAALTINELDVHYKDFQALWNVSLEVKRGEIVSIIGANGSGKSTLLNTLAGLLKPTRGSVKFLGENIGGLPPHETVPRGIVLVPEGRRMFNRLTVYENLIIGSYTPRTRLKRNHNLEDIYKLFPILRERSNQMADTLSGGEQQMLALGRALMSEPQLILCDEISLGLAPVIVKGIYQQLREINNQGITIVLVEQDIKRSLRMADRAYILLKGKIVLQGEPASLSQEKVKKAYFGI